MQLAHAISLALALPETTEAPHHEAHSFRVAKKIFATVPPDGDHLHVFVSAEEVELALTTGATWLEELRWGKKLVGLRVWLRGAKAEVVQALLESAWRQRATKRAIAEHEARREER